MVAFAKRSRFCRKVQEFFNPNCYSYSLQQNRILKCFGAGGGDKNSCKLCRKALWHECSDNDFDAIMTDFYSSGNTFVKDNFGTLNIDKFATRPGFRTVVALRPPWLTFPFEQSRYTVWYSDLYFAFVKSKEGWHSYPQLLALRNHVSAVYPITNTSLTLQACLAHYIHFFHLVTRARAHKLPLLRTDLLLALPVDILRAYVHYALDPTNWWHAPVVDNFVDVIARKRMVPRLVHSNSTRGILMDREINSSGTQMLHAIFESHIKKWHSSVCPRALWDLAHWCERSLGKSCAAFNRVYGYSNESMSALYGYSSNFSTSDVYGYSWIESMRPMYRYIPGSSP